MEEDSQRISWKDLPWKKFQRKSFQLQCKIYGATQRGNYKAIARFQKLLERSSSLYHLVLREILTSDTNIFPIQKGVTFYSKYKRILRHIHSLDSHYRNLIYEKEENLDLDDIESITCRSKLKENILQYIWVITMDPVYGNFSPKPNNCGKADIKFWSLQSYIESDLKNCKETLEKQLFSVNLTQMRCMLSTYLQMKFLTLPSKLISVDPSGFLIFGGRRLPPTVSTSFSRKMILDDLHDVKKGRLWALANKVISSYDVTNTLILRIQNTQCLKSVVVMMKDFLDIRGWDLSLLTPTVPSFNQRFEVLNSGFEWIKKEKANADPVITSWTLHKKRLKYFLKSSEISLLLRVKGVGYLAEKWSKLHYFSQGFHPKSRYYSMKMWVNKNAGSFIKTIKFI